MEKHRTNSKALLIKKNIAVRSKCIDVLLFKIDKLLHVSGGFLNTPSISSTTTIMEIVCRFLKYLIFKYFGTKVIF